jgi:hypothetical protein
VASFIVTYLDFIIPSFTLCRLGLARVLLRKYHDAKDDSKADLLQRSKVRVRLMEVCVS